MERWYLPTGPRDFTARKIDISILSVVRISCYLLSNFVKGADRHTWIDSTPLQCPHFVNVLRQSAALQMDDNCEH
jgi:hypothetical protein